MHHLLYGSTNRSEQVEVTRMQINPIICQTEQFGVFKSTGMMLSRQVLTLCVKSWSGRNHTHHWLIFFVHFSLPFRRSNLTLVLAARRDYFFSLGASTAQIPVSVNKNKPTPEKSRRRGLKNVQKELTAEFHAAAPLFDWGVIAAVSEYSSNPLVVPHNDAGYEETRQHHVAVAVNVIPVCGAWTSKVDLKPQVVTQEHHHKYNLTSNSLSDIVWIRQGSPYTNMVYPDHVAALTRAIWCLLRTVQLYSLELLLPQLSASTVAVFQEISLQHISNDVTIMALGENNKSKLVSSLHSHFDYSVL